tara:strand:+ start:264 stop:581 length:318 start_codon:yes stop_codon:yes gene_type:complete
VYKDFKYGLKYGLIFLIGAVAMGFIYGLIGGVIFQPILFSIAAVGIFSSINFIFSVVSLFVGLALYIVGKNPAVICKYFTISFAFMLVYLIFFLIVKLLPYSPFS